MNLAADGYEIFYNSCFMILRFCPRVGKLMLPLYLEFGVDIMLQVGRTVYIININIELFYSIKKYSFYNEVLEQDFILMPTIYNRNASLLVVTQ